MLIVGLATSRPVYDVSGTGLQYDYPGPAHPVLRYGNIAYACAAGFFDIYSGGSTAGRQVVQIISTYRDVVHSSGAGAVITHVYSK